jgi:hypothetical protein
MAYPPLALQWVKVLGIFSFKAHSSVLRKLVYSSLMCSFPVTLPNALMAQQPPVGHGVFIIEASRSHSDTPHSVWLLRTSDQPHTRTSTWQNTTLTSDSHSPGGIRTYNLSKQTAAHPNLRLISHCHIIQPTNKLQGKIIHTAKKKCTQILGLFVLY